VKILTSFWPFRRVSGVLIGLLPFALFSGANGDSKPTPNIPFNPDFPNASFPYAQAPDACSGWTQNNQVRDTWGPVDFRDTCNKHDACYYTLGTTSSECNDTFLENLKRACYDGLQIEVFVPAPTWNDPFAVQKSKLPPEPVSLGLCYELAEGYYLGVEAGVVLGVYDKAQETQREYEHWVESLR
jgi:hypothetical protein